MIPSDAEPLSSFSSFVEPTRLPTPERDNHHHIQVKDSENIVRITGRGFRRTRVSVFSSMGVTTPFITRLTVKETFTVNGYPHVTPAETQKKTRNIKEEGYSITFSIGHELTQTKDVSKDSYSEEGIWKVAGKEDQDKAENAIEEMNKEKDNMGNGLDITQRATYSVWGVVIGLALAALLVGVAGLAVHRRRRLNNTILEELRARVD